MPSVHLWQSGAAYLYDVTVVTLRGAKCRTLLNTYIVATGFRTVEVSDAKFLIDNSPFSFTGFGKHEDTAVRGKGHDPAYMVHDVELLR